MRAHSAEMDCSAADRASADRRDGGRQSADQENAGMYSAVPGLRRQRRGRPLRRMDLDKAARRGRPVGVRPARRHTR